MGAMTDMFDGMQPSETGRTGATVDDLASNVPSGKGDQWGQYLRLMQYLTQPRKDAGPAARRAMGGLPAGPRDVDDPVELQTPGGGSSLMAMLFGGLSR